MHWQAEYKNGTIITENDGISADNLNREQIKSFLIVEENRVAFMLHLEYGDRFFYRRRTEKKQDRNADRVCHVIGRYRGEEMIAVFVFENGIIHLVSHFDDKHPWFYSPEFLPGEV